MKRKWLLWSALAVVAVVAVAGVVLKPRPGPIDLNEHIGEFFARGYDYTPWLRSYEKRSQFVAVSDGPIRWRVRLDSIEEVVPTRNPLSSPALSLDRLRIRYSGSRMGIMISPENKAIFMQDLAARVDGLEVEGERVVRRLEVL